MKKIKKPYAAVNTYTGLVVKRFKSAEKLYNYLFKPRSTIVGNISPTSMGVAGAMIVSETEEVIRELGGGIVERIPAQVDVELIEWEYAK